MMVRRFWGATRRYARDEAGASLIEYTIVVSLFLLMIFAILDFGRLGFNWVMTEKAMQRAARIATVRPPVCAGVPETHALLSTSTNSFGALCRAGSTCVNGGVQQCVLSAGPIDCGNVTDTGEEIWCILEPILPSNATPQNIRVRYEYDPNGNLGFAGGPYTPMVEVGVVTAADLGIPNAQELRFQFITPIPGFAAMVGGSPPAVITDSGSDGVADIPFPDLSVSMPGEDLNVGTNG